MRIPRPVGTLSYALARLAPWRPAIRVRAKPSGLSFWVHWRDSNGRHIAKYGGLEPQLTRWIDEHLAASGSGIFVDVGANIGWHSLHAARHAAVETVLAFEPDIFNAWLLDRSLTANDIDNVVVNVSAVGAKSGLTRLFRYKRSNLGRHSVLTDYGFGSRVVPMTTLDAAIEALGLSDRRILVLKVDAEGYEPAVIAGAERALARAEVIVTEYSPELIQSGGLSARDMLDRLQSAGFTPHEVSAGGRLAEVAVNHLPRLRRQVDLVWTKTKS
jgi:FkbM family methyltransferase